MLEGERVMSKKEFKTNAMRMLDKEKIPYKVYTYACEEFLDGIQVVVTSCVGVLLIAAAVEGYLRGRLNVLMRLISFGAAVLLIDSQPVTDIIGVACLVLILAAQMFIFHRSDRSNTASA